jgi:hypothetical protein
MKKTILSVCAALLISGAVAAVDIPMRDGSVIAAESYRLTGSYIMIELPNGAQVAYDAADVDLPALRAAEAEAAGSSGEEQSAPDAGGDYISGGRTLKNAADVGGEETGKRAITDRDVRHVRRGVEGDEEGEGGQGESGGAPDGSQQGGGVVLNNLQVTALGEGSWNVEGEVVNGLSEPVLNVKVKLQASTSGEPWTGEVPVASILQPNETSVFSHSFSAEIPSNRTQPDVRASVMWMQQQSRREPDYTKAGGVPHPSNLPLQHGGVSGADVVPQPTPVQ